MTPQPILQLSHVNKQFGRHQILHDVSFETYGGEVFGFLGPNGAGKTTTIKLVTGLLTLQEGEIIICGFDLHRSFESALSQMGAIVENPEFYGYLSGLENLRQAASMHGNITEARIREVVHLVGMEHRITEKVSKYSLGMRQRLGIARAILHRPKLLVLDEPTNGLDAAAIKALRDLLRSLAHEEGVSVLISSHLMSEMEQMCDRVGVIVNGTMQSVQSIEELVAATAPDTVEFILHVSDATRAQGLLTEIMELQTRLEAPDQLAVTVPLKKSEALIALINRTLILNNIELLTVSRKENRRLEDVFIELTRNGGIQID